MKPSIGRIVIIKNFYSNGATEQPAVITRAWNDTSGPLGSACINVMVLPDGGIPECRTSLYLFENREQAEAYIASQTKDYPLMKPVVCFWPDRV